MSFIWLEGIEVGNYRSFGEKQSFRFPDKDYGKPISIVGYNNCGKTNLMNSILYALNYNYVGKDTFSIDDFHNRNIDNCPSILLKAVSSEEYKINGKIANYTGYHRLKIHIDADEIEGSEIESFIIENGEDKPSFGAFGASKYFKIFYVNFHKIKDEIITQKTSWGNLRSFLAKHIKEITDIDDVMIGKKDEFKESIDNATNSILENSNLDIFIKSIQKNYIKNLRDNACKVEFGLPEYEDIFLQMMFKIGLNGDSENLVPISHFGDGYISMFVMAVIQAIAESNSEDKCLFLFEEPESFLHENHQEYFYKQVLCSLSNEGHQVIYTTHSDRMVDIFDTKSIIRLENDDENQTVKKYNNIEDLSIDPIEISKYNQFIKSIEPNLNKILFSKKVILVEGPNDLMVYNYIIKKEVLNFIQDKDEILDKERYSETYLNFKNISVIPHHGKQTVHLLIKLCNHLGINYFVINDFDLDNNLINELNNYESLSAMKSGDEYSILDSNGKGKLTSNYNILKASKDNQYHFNIPRLEEMVGYNDNDKNSLNIWNVLQESESFGVDIFPNKLKDFLELTISEDNQEEQPQSYDIPLEDIPF